MSGGSSPSGRSSAGDRAAVAGSHAPPWRCCCSRISRIRCSGRMKPRPRCSGVESSSSATRRSTRARTSSTSSGPTSRSASMNARMRTSAPPGASSTSPCPGCGGPKASTIPGRRRRAYACRSRWRARSGSRSSPAPRGPPCRARRRSLLQRALPRLRVPLDLAAAAPARGPLLPARRAAGRARSSSSSCASRSSERSACAPTRAAISVLLFLLFNTFFAAFFSVLAVLALERGAPRRARAAPAAAGARRGGAAAGLVRDLPDRCRRSRASSRSGRAACSRTSRSWAAHLLRHEFLLPALACRAALIAVDRAARRRGAAPEPDALRATSGFLWLLAGGYALLGCANPLPLERYFVVLSPLLTLVFLLDAFALRAAVSRAVAPAREARAARATVAALVALVLRRALLGARRGRRPGRGRSRRPIAGRSTRS